MNQPHHYFDGKLLFVSKAVATKAQLIKRGMSENDYELNRFAILQDPNDPMWGMQASNIAAM
jgi:hypothetical protein